MGQLEGCSRCRPPLLQTTMSWSEGMVVTPILWPLALCQVNFLADGEPVVQEWSVDFCRATEPETYQDICDTTISITAITSYGAQKRHRNEKPLVMTGDFPYLPSGQETS